MQEMRYKTFEDKPTLFRESEQNAGYDLFARIPEGSVEIKPNEVVTIRLNVATEIPADAVGLLFQRSSTFDKWGIKLVNNVGVIDSLYCGDNDEWAGRFRNETDKPQVIKDGDKICQAVFLPILPLTLVKVDSLENEDRGGFGTSFDNIESKGR